MRGPAKNGVWSPHPRPGTVHQPQSRNQHCGRIHDKPYFRDEFCKALRVAQAALIDILGAIMQIFDICFYTILFKRSAPPHPHADGPASQSDAEIAGVEWAFRPDDESLGSCAWIELQNIGGFLEGHN